MAKTIPAVEPIAKPPSASLNVNQPAPRACASRPRACCRCRSATAAGTSGCRTTAIAPCQIASVATSTSAAGSQSRACRAARRPWPGCDRGAHSGLRPQRRLLLGQQVLAAAAQELAHLGHELEEARLLARLDRARDTARSIGDDPGDPARPRAHHDDARREEDRLGDRVRDEDDRRARAAARSRAAPGSGARASSRRARRTARPSAAAPARTRARGRSRRAAACRPRAATDGGRRSPSARRARASRSTRSLRRARSQPSISSGSAMFFATVRQSKSTASWKTIP